MDNWCDDREIRLHTQQVACGFLELSRSSKAMFLVSILVPAFGLQVLADTGKARNRDTSRPAINSPAAGDGEHDRANERYARWHYRADDGQAGSDE